MSHVDEGLLHAWLDGAFVEGDAERAAIEAHLALCEDCRVRLDDARRVKQHAHAALGHLAPEPMPEPAWDSVLAEHHARNRGGSGGASPSSRPRPWIPMAWAASLVLAVGAGWMANQLFDLRPAAGRLDAPLQQEARSSTAAEGVQETESLPRERNEADAADRLGQSRDADSRRAAISPALPDPELQQRQLRAAAPPAEPDFAQGRGGRANVPPPSLSNLVGGRLADSMTIVPLTVTGAVMEKVAAQSTVFSDLAPDTLERLVARADSLGEPFRTMTRDYIELTRANAWSTITTIDAEMRLGRAPAMIDGVAADSVQSGEREGRTLVRSLHRLEDGTPVELLHSAAGAASHQYRVQAAERAVAADEMRERREVSVEGARIIPATVPGLTVLLLANLPADRARSVADRVR